MRSTTGQQEEEKARPERSGALYSLAFFVGGVTTGIARLHYLDRGAGADKLRLWLQVKGKGRSGRPGERTASEGREVQQLGICGRAGAGSCCAERLNA